MKNYFTSSHIENMISYVFNIGRHEWLKVSLCWWQKFFVGASHVVGHTILIAMFAKRIGVENLPYLFIADALLIFFATAIFTPLIEKFRKERLLVIIAIVATLFLITGWLMDPSSILFYVVLLMATSLFISQFTIISALYIEDQFSPLESQRTFPVIESAEILSALVAGFVLFFISNFHIEAKHVILLWAFFVLFAGISVLIYQKVSHRFPYLHFLKEEDKVSKNIFRDLDKVVQSIRHNNFLSMLAFIAFIQVVIAIILEYQYTSALSHATDAHGAGGGHGEMDLTHALSMYIVLFASTGMVLQVFLGSRIVKWFGVVKTMLLNPVLSAFGFMAMMAHFTQATAIGGKYVYDLTNLFYKNAYLSSYYTVNKSIREKAKAMIEGWVMPIGTITGTIIILILNHVYHGESLNVLLNTTLIIFAILMAFLFRKLKKSYTEQSVIGLRSNDLSSKFTAIEILGEHGHKNSLHALVQAVTMPHQKETVKIKILETFGRLQIIRTVPNILDEFEDESKEVKIAAVKALGAFGKGLGKKFFEQAFTHHRIVSQLEELFIKEPSQELKSEIIKVMAYLHEKETVPLLLKVMKSDNDVLVAAALHVVGHEFQDLNIAYYIREHLQSESARVKTNAVIALWQFKQYRLKLLVEIVQMLSRKDKDGILSTIYLLGELKSHQEVKKLLEYLKHEDPDIRRYSAIALAKLDHDDSVNVLMTCIFREDIPTSKKTIRMLEEVETGIKKIVERLMQQEASRQIHSILAPVEYHPGKLKHVKVKKLIFLYKIIGAREEVEQLRELAAPPPST